MGQLKPISDKVLILPDAAETLSPGGILLAPAKEETVQKGQVLAVGPGATNSEGTLIPMQVKVGDKVMFDSKQTVHIDIAGQKYYLISEFKKLGVL
jgi:chaperonin GroES